MALSQTAASISSEMCLILMATSKRFLQPRFEDIIDQDQRVAQSTLADETEDAMKDPSRLPSQPATGFERAFDRARAR